MHKRAVSLMLSLILIGSNAESLKVYANNNEQEKWQINISNKIDEEQNKIQGSIHKVYNTAQLQDAINIANEGDLIKVYEGNYSDSDITLTKSNITIEGYDNNDNPIVNNTNAIITNAKFKINADNVVLKGIETKDIQVGYYGPIQQIVANDTKIVDCLVRGTLYIGTTFSKEVANNTLVEGTYVSSRIKVDDSNNIIRDTKTTGIYIEGHTTLVNNCDVSFLEIGSRDEVIENIKVQDTKVDRYLEVGKDSTSARNIELENLDVYVAYIGYSSGTASNISIVNSRIDDCMMGMDNRARITDSSIKDSDIKELRIGGYSGTAKNIEISNSNITQVLRIGENEGTSENTLIDNSNISAKSLEIGTLKGNSKNAKILNSNISGEIAIGDKSSPSNTINTLIETDNTNIVDMGNNTVVINYLKEGVNKLKGQASQGIRIELIKDQVTLISEVIANDKIIDTYLNETNKDFSLSKGDNVTLNIYDLNNNNIFSENIIAEGIEVSLIKPKVDALADVSTHIKGYVHPYSQVFVLRENQNETDNSVLNYTTGKDGHFNLEIGDLKNNEILRVYSKDNSNKISETVEVKVIDSKPPQFINVDPITEKSTSIKGTVSEEANIEVLYQGESIGNGESDSNGKFEISIQGNKLSPNQEITLIARDALNNASYNTLKINESLTFIDVDGHWAKDDIYYFVDQGYINGYSDNTFRPDNKITRGEFVKITNRVYGFTEIGEINFIDVGPHEWYADEVAIAVKAGYINGKSPQIFDPNAPITREEVAKIISVLEKCIDNNYDKLEGFADKNIVSSWAMPYVEGVIEAGYMNGYSDNTFKPTQSITRAEAVVTLKRTIK